MKKSLFGLLLSLFALFAKGDGRPSPLRRRLSSCGTLTQCYLENLKLGTTIPLNGEGDSYSLDDGDEFSVFCDTEGNIDTVLFLYDGRRHQERKQVWYMAGDTPGWVNRVGYLKSCGSKMVRVQGKVEGLDPCFDVTLKFTLLCDTLTQQTESPTPGPTTTPTYALPTTIPTRPVVTNPPTPKITQSPATANPTTQSPTTSPTRVDPIDPTSEPKTQIDPTAYPTTQSPTTAYPTTSTTSANPTVAVATPEPTFNPTPDPTTHCDRTYSFGGNDSLCPRKPGARSPGFTGTGYRCKPDLSCYYKARTTCNGYCFPGLVLTCSKYVTHLTEGDLITWDWKKTHEAEQPVCN